ncbi:hypothetical protein [Streptomyces sp. NBC_00096]|uniref:hypothetical protein n=1 Tax=Streptomyces sp. NBC_00096 TaxID=2975650 RepID=UPI003243F971
MVPGSAWGQFHEAVEAFFDLARTDADTARQLLWIITLRCRSLEDFDQDRRFLIGSGIPETLLPDALGLGRLDLRSRPG